MNARRLIVGILAVLCATACASLGFGSASALADREYVVTGAFGAEGAGDGEFREPAGVAVNTSTEPLVQSAAGDVYVIDTGNARVERFDSAGAYIGQWDGTSTLAKGFLFSAGADRQGIAVDNSTNPLDPSGSDVYVADVGNKVVDQFGAEGTFTGLELTGTCAAPGTCPGKVVPFPGELLGVTVDPSGNIWIVESDKTFDEFSDTGAFLGSFSTSRGTQPGLAAGAGGDLYMVFGSERAGKFVGGEEVAEFGSQALSLAIDQASGEVLVGKSSNIERFAPVSQGSPEPLEDFPSSGLSESFGMAVGAGSEPTVYASQRGAADVEILQPRVVPVVSTEQASVASETAVSLHGRVNPGGEAISECKFEYATDAAFKETGGEYTGGSAQCQPNSAAIGEGIDPVAVSAELTGLQPLSTYHFRLVVANGNAVVHGGDETLYTGTKPSVEAEAISGIGSDEAIVSARINPNGFQSGYSVEYGSSLGYGSITPEASVGAGVEAASIQVNLRGLQPGTLYHARVVAKNSLGEAQGGDLTFTTVGSAGPTSSALPDGRVYELASALGSSAGNVYVPSTGHQLESSHQIYSGNPVRAAANGNAVAYVAEPPPGSGGSGSSGDGQGNVFIATRSSAGWKASSIMPPVKNGEIYQGFSGDLSLSFLASFEGALTPDAPANCEVFYSRSTSDGAYHALVTNPVHSGECGFPTFAGVSADDSSTVFESWAALTPEAVPGNKQERHQTFNLYDYSGGNLYLVNVLPNGTPDPNGAVGGVSLLGEETSEEEYLQSQWGYHHYGQAVSEDGSRVVWTDISTAASSENPTGETRLFLRENPTSPSATTIQLDALLGGGGQYRGASSDGSRIYFTKSGDLYEYDVSAAATNDLAPSGEVLGVSDVSADGNYVYFVAEGVLAANENGNGEKASHGQPNLYVHDGAGNSFVATLSPEDNSMRGLNNNSNEHFWGDWRASLETRTAQTSADGRHLVFMSRRKLTGYDNEGECRGAEGEPDVGCPEVFVYEAGTQRIWCASCNPSGEPPVAALANNAELVGGAFLPSPASRATGAYALRWISGDGARVFFDTAEPLVPWDVNGVQDVYEWERDGSGSCGQATGCVYLISSNLSSEEAYLLDSSATGDDVFFTSRAQLLPEEGGNEVELYDARVNGGFPKVSTECTGTGCQGLPPAPPIFATPSSVTFAGVGNFEAPKPASKAKSKAKPKPARCKKGSVKRHGRCVKKAAGKTKKAARGKKSNKRSHRGRK